MNKLLLVNLLIIMTVVTGCVGPDSLIRVHAYEGRPKPKEELATVFAVFNGVNTEMAMICTVDGKSYSKMGAISNCPSVVSLTPGKHKLGLNYRFANYYGNKEIDIDVKAKQTYEVRATSEDGLETITFYIKEMPEDFVLKYKHILPSMPKKYAHQGEVIVPIENPNY